MELNLIKSNCTHCIITINNLLNDKTLKTFPWDQKLEKMTSSHLFIDSPIPWNNAKKERGYQNWREKWKSLFRDYIKVYAKNLN